MERTKEQEALILETLISERSTIIYVLESSLEDEKDVWHKEYKRAIRDEIQNHKLALNEYQEGLRKLKQS